MLHTSQIYQETSKTNGMVVEKRRDE
ncbi:MAG: hypothetical protein EZS28_053922, partial [Streblomastix strix]